MKHILVAILVASAAASLAGCSTLPGHVSTSTSALDGESQIHVAPGWVRNPSSSVSLIKLGGFWSDKSPDKFHLEVVYCDTVRIDGLKIGIDGDIVDLEPSGPTTFDYIAGTYNQFASIPGHPESSRRFTVPLELVERMVAAEKVVLRLSLGNTYSEGLFSFSQHTFAKGAFKKALEKISQRAEVETR